MLFASAGTIETRPGHLAISTAINRNVPKILVAHARCLTRDDHDGSLYVMYIVAA